MAKWFAPSVLDSGLDHVRTETTTLHLLKAYAAGDSFAVVTATNSLGSVVLDTADKVLGDQGVNGRRLVIAAKTITGVTASGVAPDLHIAICSGSVVLAVTDETSDQQIFAGNDVNVPTFSLNMNQPT